MSETPGGATSLQLANRRTHSSSRVSEQIVPLSSDAASYEWVFEHIPSSSHSPATALPASLAPSVAYPGLPGPKHRSSTGTVASLTSETGLSFVPGGIPHPSTNQRFPGALRIAATHSNRHMSSFVTNIQEVGLDPGGDRHAQGLTTAKIYADGYETRQTGHRHVNLLDNLVWFIVTQPPEVPTTDERRRLQAINNEAAPLSTSVVQSQAPSVGVAEVLHPRSALASRAEQVPSPTEVNNHGPVSQNLTSRATMGMADNLLDHPLQASAERQVGSGRYGTLYVPQTTIQEPTDDTAQVSHPSAVYNRMPTDNIPVRGCPYISGSEVVAFAPRYQGIIRELYLPGEFGKWKQLVRAGVLIVGLVEQLREGCNMGQIQELLQNSGDISAPEWISEWLDLQPLTRFRCPKASVRNPSMLLYPSYTVPHEWRLFWIRSAHIVFRTLLGLRNCCPNPSSRAQRNLMDPNEWNAWADDVLWVFCQLIDLARLHGRSIFVVPVHLASAAQALRESYLHAGNHQMVDDSSPLAMGRQWKAKSLQAAPHELSTLTGSSSLKRRYANVEIGDTKRQRTM
ncbi:hypothetical protein C8T65DRAFT_699037 [Cerioporus squamosus]|nr:hypothetical protein C8T65DRAFT_699037 [Cerioporus squamosus]